MSWAYRMRWVRVDGRWHIDNCMSDDFVSVCGVTYTTRHEKAHKEPKGTVCRKCKRLVVPMILRHGPPQFFPDSYQANFT